MKSMLSPCLVTPTRSLVSRFVPLSSQLCLPRPTFTPNLTSYCPSSLSVAASAARSTRCASTGHSLNGSDKKQQYNRYRSSFTWGLSATVAAFVPFVLPLDQDDDFQPQPQPNLSLHPVDDGHQQFRLTDVAKHDASAERKWVVRGTQVYDITDFVEAHPGGEVILRACGGSIDPFWKLFKIHDAPMVRDILNQYLIGEIHPDDLDATGSVDWSSLGTGMEITDPFWDDPVRDSRLLVHTATPCNAETPAEFLASTFITPIQLFFVRNHLWVPRIKPEDHKVTVEFSGGDESTVHMDDLKSKFQEYTITATLQCSGNRRKHMSESARGTTSGLQWDVGAISTAEFTGVRLCDVLRNAGYEEKIGEENGDKHIHFSCSTDTYSVSIPLSTALARSADVLLAFKMNGKDISRDHGGPLRVIVPGTTAARSVKWVDRMVLSSEEADSQWQRRDYKCFAPNVRSKDLTDEDWDREQSIQETPVQSAITSVREQDDRVILQGFAFSGGGRAITRIDVSGDGGKTWHQATKQEDDAKGSKRWAWSLWDLELPKQSKSDSQQPTYMVKATDDSYNTQPEHFDAIWNFRGLLANAWHRVSLSKPVKE